MDEGGGRRGGDMEVMSTCIGVNDGDLYLSAWCRHGVGIA